MNQKFCGDSRDLFKYDLIHKVMKQVPELESLTIIPMQTEFNKSKWNSNAGRGNKKLVRLFTPFSCENGEELYFNQIRKYFESEGIKITILNEERFTRENRDTYFDNVLGKLQKNSLIFFDPDTGLAEKNATEKHMKFPELKMAYEKIKDTNSILMIYQHHPLVQDDEHRKEFPSKKREEVKRNGLNDPMVISDGGILFVFLAGNSAVRNKVAGVLGKYAADYNIIFEKS